MPTSDDDDMDSGAERNTPAPPRRIIDVQLDDGDDNWEDLPTLGTSTHRSRNLAEPRALNQKHKRVAGGKNARASALKKRGANASKMTRLGGDLDAIDEERDRHAERLAEKYSMKVKDVRRRMAASSSYKERRKPSLYNAKISALMAEQNADREEGNRLSLSDIKAMVRDDPSLLEGYTAEEEEEMLANLAGKRELKHRGTRSDNISANADIKRTVGRLVEELNGMAQRANMVGFAMFSRGHLHDTSTPTTISTGGVLDFFRDILKKEPADVGALFELWVVNREQGAKGPNALRTMQKECTDMILTGLRAVTKRTKVAMNYDNYIKSIVEGKNVGLVGWPQGVAFKRIGDLSLEGSHSHRAGPRRRELRGYGGEGGGEGEGEEGGGTTARKSSCATTKKSSANKRGKASRDESGEEDESEEGESGEDESGGEGTGRGGTVRERLLALVEKQKAKAGKEAKSKSKAAHDNDAKRKTTATKPKRTSARNGKAPVKSKPKKGGGNAEPSAKKRKQSAGDGDGEPPPKKCKTTIAGEGEPARKHKAKADGGDGGPPAKRKKMSAEEEEPAPPAVPRPKPRRLHKKPASAAPARPVSPTPRSPAASAVPASAAPTRPVSPTPPSPAAAPARPVSPTPRSPAAEAPPAFPKCAAPEAARSVSQALRATVKGKRGGPPGQR
ncbi:hypothetical protein B0H19DRAFT_1055620 [Mycena capillaripes]|nr:hypothetical protein B0H19DRAFT_1055620 [Mycena capillaripes]